jgi:hypothetical protein
MDYGNRNLARKLRTLAAILGLASLTAGPVALHAQQMNSTNYRIPFDDLSGGGLRSSSTNYLLEDTVAEQASPTGEGLSSTNYLACVGFQCLQEAPFLTVTFSVQSTACDATSSSSPPYAVPLGTLSTSAVTTAANHICVRVTANASGGVTVRGKSQNAALASVSTPADTIASQSETLTAGDPGYGFCSDNASGFTAQAPFNGSCDTTSAHAVGAITTSDQTIWSVATPINNAFGDLLTKAAISATVPAHNDYRDVLTLTVTGTY